MRLVIPEHFGLRGAGLGNEALPWCKAFLCAQSVGASYLNPAWSINPRKYRKFFRSPRLDWILQATLKHTPITVTFTEADYRSTGIEDIGKAFEVWAENNGLTESSNWIVLVGGLWGGYWSIRRARSFLYSNLGHTRYTQENLANSFLEFSNIRPVCAVHLRGGDFAESNQQESLAGKFNIVLPYEWYESAIESVYTAFNGEIDLFVLTNDHSPRVQAIINKYNAKSTNHLENTDISDLLLMSHADILIPSISSFSSLAPFMNPSLDYLWPKEHLTHLEGQKDLRGIWAQTASQTDESSPTLKLAHEMNAQTRGRAFEYTMNDPLPKSLRERLESKVHARTRNLDLINYGSIRI